MKVYRKVLLQREFGFLSQLPGFDEVNEIKIKRGDASLLRKTGKEDVYSWSGGGHDDHTIFYAVTVSGIQRLATEGHSSTGSGESRDWLAPTNGEQLFEMGLTPDFIVECVQQDTDNNGNGQRHLNWTIYKMTRFDLAAYHKLQIDQAAAELKAEIDAACAAPA